MSRIDESRPFIPVGIAVLTVSEQSEHPFMAESDAPIVADWLEANI